MSILLGVCVFLTIFFLVNIVSLWVMMISLTISYAGKELKNLKFNGLLIQIIGLALSVVGIIYEVMK